MKFDRRLLMGAFARLRGALPFVVNDALFRLPVDVTAATPEVCRARGWELHELGPRIERLPDVLDGTDPNVVARLRREVVGVDREATIFAAVIPNGRVLSRACSAVAPRGIVLADVSPHAGVPLRHHRALTSALAARAPTRLRGRSALIGAVGHRNFYHWMFDAIPRVALLRDAGVETVDRWIVPATDLEVARELLELAGVPHDRLHALRRSDHVVCDELVVTSAPGEICEPTPRTVEALRTMLDPGGLRLAQRSGERNVYIARRGRRRVANERELASILERRGFEFVAMEGLSLAEQIARVRGATCVVAPHGAALSHLIHAADGAVCLELLAPDYTNPSFYVLAGACGLRYAALEGTRVAREPRDVTVAKFHVDPTRFESVLDRALASRRVT